MVPEQFESEVSARAKRFDLVALVRLLEAHGYASERTFFESKAELTSASSLVEAVRFWNRDEAEFHTHGAVRPASSYVTVTVNVGLLGGQGLLPAYFQTILDESHDPERMLAFLRFFDQRLLAELVRAACPERDPALFPDLPGTRRALFQLLGVESLSTMHWLFQCIFPELRLHVSRQPLPQADAGYGARAGASSLDGTAVVGKLYETQTSGFAVRLVSDHEHHDHGERWFDIATERMQRCVLPLLSRFRFALHVALDLPHRTPAVVEPERLAWYEERSQLGYQRVLGRLPDGIGWPARDTPTRESARRWERKLGARHVVEVYRGTVGVVAQRLSAEPDASDAGIERARRRFLDSFKYRHLQTREV